MSKLLHKSSLLLLGLMIMSQLLLAQTRTISGIVKDSNGNPITGATVKVKGTKNGTATNENGAFAIAVSDKNTTLNISAIGYDKREMAIGDKNNLNVTLQTNDQQLTEVTVTGALGIKKNVKNLGYATAQVKGDEITRTNTINPITALQGKVAGLSISVPSANGIQTSPYIQIRGAKVLGGNNQPIFVVDGNVLINNINDADNTDGGSQLKNLNPDDYESIEVLKGASATALYGSRGINGAIVITTKKGKMGNGLGIEFNSTYQTQQIYRAPMDYQNDYGQGSWASAEGNFRPDGTMAQTMFSFGPKFDGTMHPAVHNFNIKVPYVAQPDNWRAFYQNGSYVNNNISLSGATEKFNYRLSYSNNQTKGPIRNNELSRNALTFKVEGQLNKVFTTELGVNYANTSTRNYISQGRYYYGGGQNLGFNTYYLPRNLDTKTWYETYRKADNSIDGSALYGNLSSVSNAFANFDKNNSFNRENSFLAYSQIKAQVTDWLDLTARGNVNFMLTHSETQNKGNETLNKGGSFGSGGSHSSSYTFLFTAHATHDFLNKDLKTDFRLVSEIYGDQMGESYGASTSGGLAVPNQFFLANSALNYQNNINYNMSRPSTRTYGLVGVLNLNYKEYLNLELSGRNDWLSTLTYPYAVIGGGNNYSVFYPAANASYQFYDHLKASLPSWLSAGQLRASIAYVGNQGVAGPYTTGSGYSPAAILNQDGQSVGVATQYRANIQPNLNIKPQRQQSIEIGTNLGFLKNLFNLDFTYYKTNTFDQLLNLPGVSETGYNQIFFNAGNIQNQGVEVTLSIKPLRSKDWGLDMNILFSRNRNKIISFGNGIKEWGLSDAYDGASVFAYEGGEFGQLVAENWASIKTDKKTGFPLITVGDMRENTNELDKHKFQMYNYSFYAPEDGRGVIGNVQPKFNGGFNGTLRYKNLSLYTQFDGSFGGWTYSEALNYAMAQGTPQASLQYRDQAHGGVARTDSYNGKTRYDGAIPNVVFDAGQMSPLKPSETIAGMTYKEAFEKGLVTPWKASAYYVSSFGWGTNVNSPQNISTSENSWFMLREVTLGYKLPSKITDKLHIKGLRINLTARNIGYLYKTLKGGQNPESLQSNNPFSPYITGGVPFTRNYAATLSLQF